MIGNLIGMVYLGIIVGTNFAYKEPLFEESLEIMRSMQTDDESIINLYAWMGYGANVEVIYFFAFIFVGIMPYAEGLFVLFELFFASLVSGWMKQLHHDPRPFWVETYDAHGCIFSYANPSGHNIYYYSQHTTMFYLLFYAKMRGRYSLDWNYNRKNPIYIACYVGILVLFLIICLPGFVGRVFEGAHSLDQMIYGFFVGSGIFLYTVFVLRPVLMKYFYKFTDRRCTGKE